MAHLTQNIFDKLPIGLLKFALNLWPPFWGAGIRVKSISPDFRHIAVRMKLHWFNRNYMGVHFGGSLYSMTDPFPMLMVIRNLGKDYIVWDKAAKINYIKPGKNTVFANFEISPETIEHIRNEADSREKYFYDFPIEVKDKNDETIATVIKTLYVRRKTQNPSP